MASTDTGTRLLEAATSATLVINDSYRGGYIDGPDSANTSGISFFTDSPRQWLSQQQRLGNLPIREHSLKNDDALNWERPTHDVFNHLATGYISLVRVRQDNRLMRVWLAALSPDEEQTNPQISGSQTWSTDIIQPDAASPSDPLNIKRQLTELKDLKEGWADGMQNVRDWGSGFGKAPSHDGLDWLATQFERLYPDGAPRPFIYPTPEGGVQAEWSLGDIESSLEIDISAHTAEWFRTDLKSDSSDERIVNLDDPKDWRWVTDRLRRDAN